MVLKLMQLGTWLTDLWRDERHVINLPESKHSVDRSLKKLGGFAEDWNVVKPT